MVVDGKNDLNRVGWFSEMGYISIGDPYKSKKNGNSMRFRCPYYLIYWTFCNFNLMIVHIEFIMRYIKKYSSALLSTNLNVLPDFSFYLK